MNKKEQVLLTSIVYMAWDFAIDAQKTRILKLAKDEAINPEMRDIIVETFSLQTTRAGSARGLS